MKNAIISSVALSVICVSPLALAKVNGPTMMSVENIGVSEVLAWSWGASNAGSFHTGGGGGAGKANFQDISITRFSDSQSAALLAAVANGDSIGNVEMKREGLLIRMERVLVTSYSVGGMTDKKAAQTENISLNFAKVWFEIDGSGYCYSMDDTNPC
ncbi:type VI secretion system tube protein Hcp [Vibrio sp.]|uniref:type VI secretion system tube protein Hcp n=1 Tax=Vibrio sp. TaxID=678 RepID=UPI003D0A85A1